MVDDDEIESLRARHLGARRPTVTLHIDLTLVTGLARALQLIDPIWYSDAAARAAGLPAVPAPPTFPFAIPYLAVAHAPPGSPAGVDEISPLLRLLAGPSGLVMHGEQGFVYRRTVYVGDTLTGGEQVVDLARRVTTTGRRLDSVASRTEWTDAGGEVVIEATKIVVVVHEPST